MDSSGKIVKKSGSTVNNMKGERGGRDGEKRSPL